jgi:hypothetical protein
MAIITCPLCSKKISDKALECPHCGASMDMDVEERERISSRLNSKKIQQISMQNMFAVVLFMAGFYIMYFQSPAEDSMQLKLSQAAVALGFLWYVVNRIRHFLIKTAMKKR